MRTNVELRDSIGLTNGLPDYKGPELVKTTYPPMAACSEKQYVRMLTKRQRRDFWIWFVVAILGAVTFVGTVWNATAYFVE